MIESLENKKVKNWTKLHLKKYRNEEYLLLSKDLVDLAFKTGNLKTLIYCESKPFSFNEAYEVSQEVLNKISKKEGLKYIGIGKRIKESNNLSNRIMILDDLSDPLNIGRIMESAYLFGFNTLIISDNTADIYNEKCLEASKGFIYKLDIKRCNINKQIELLKNRGYKICATGLRDNTISLANLKKTNKMAFILGNEGSGVKEEIFKLADEVIKIDMHNIDSLNVAMAGAIVMYNFSDI